MEQVGILTDLSRTMEHSSKIRDNTSGDPISLMYYILYISSSQIFQLQSSNYLRIVTLYISQRTKNHTK